MSELIIRSYELHDMAVKGRTLTLAVVPFDRPAWVDDGQGPYRERFRSGAFKHIDPTRVQLRYQHSQDMMDRIGVGQALREDGGYLIGEARVFRGDRGDHLLNLVDDGALQGISAGFVAGESRTVQDADGPLVERVRVKSLPEISLVDEPAYAGAQVLAVRSAKRAAEREALARWLADMRRFAV